MTLTTQQKLEAITARICEVVPHFSVVRCNHCEEPCPIVPCKCSSHDSYTDIKDATLEDVLATLEHFDRGDIYVYATGRIAGAKGMFQKEVSWIFGKSLQDQGSPPLIDWLYSLLPSSK